MPSKDIVGTDYLKVNKDYRINVSKILPDDVKRDLTYPMVVNVAMSKTWPCVVMYFEQDKQFNEEDAIADTIKKTIIDESGMVELNPEFAEYAQLPIGKKETVIVGMGHGIYIWNDAILEQCLADIDIDKLVNEIDWETTTKRR